MPPQPQHRHREVERAVAPPPLPEPPAPQNAIAGGIAPAATSAPAPLSAHRAAMIGKLTAEYRERVALFHANAETIDRLNAENAKIRLRLAAIDSEIRINAWDGEPLALIR